MSLRTGGQVGTTLTAIINPNNLKIEGFVCEDKLEKKRRPVLLAQDIRDLITQGFVVNDHEALSDPAELVRLTDVLAINFQLVGKTVETVSKEKVGKVTDYAAESSTLYIQKFYVGQSLLKSISGGRLSIDRTNIVEITDRKIIIQDLLKTAKMPATAAGAAA